MEHRRHIQTRRPIASGWCFPFCGMTLNTAQRVVQVQCGLSELVSSREVKNKCERLKSGYVS
eukprot:3160038-Amphidinium_carterae.2